MSAADSLYFTSAPSVAVPQAQPSSYFNTNHYTSDSNGDIATDGLDGALTPGSALAPTPGSLAGRKRSRGDIYAMEDEGQAAADGLTQTPAFALTPSLREGPIFGAGQSPLYPNDPSYEVRPESQSSTRVEGRAQPSQWHMSDEGRPRIATRKSQRVDGTVSDSDDLAQLVLPPGIREVTAEPLIDEATRALGISWTRMDSSEALRISQAAYSKWIQNHYPSLNQVATWFENSALPGYLVAAQNAYSLEMEYYIFSHDLVEARLVTKDAKQLLPRLQLLPALHLAAPGGHIYAQMDVIPAAVAMEPVAGGLAPQSTSGDSSSSSRILSGQVPPMDTEMG